MIGAIGLNHKSAPVTIRESFSFTPEEVTTFIGALFERTGITEAALLSTCNRTEIYYYIQKECEANYHHRIISFLAEYKEVMLDVKEYFYSYRDEGAVEHILNVASGLNSMVLGENQILGQIKEAYRISSEQKFTGPVLNRLFHKAFEAGKKVRTDTGINKGASSISFASVELCERIFKNLSDHPVLLIGAGETGDLVLQGLTNRGTANITVMNRTYEKACSVASRYGGRSERFENLKQALIEGDIIITSTASKEPILVYSMIKEIMKSRKNRTMFFIDLSVPRNIDEKIKDIENAFLYNIDDLEKVVAHNYEKRKNEIEKAHFIVQGISRDFLAWFSTLKITPTIELLKNKFDDVNKQELKRLKNRLPENEYQKVEEYACFIKGKYLGLVIKNLKNYSNNGDKVEYIDLVNNLFELRKGAANER